MRLLQWNVLYKEDVNNIVSALKEVDADILCLQELTVNYPEYNPGLDVPKVIADELGFNLFFKDAQNATLNGVESKFGSAVLSRFPLTRTDFKYIQEPLDPNIQDVDYSKEGRVYVEADIQLPNKILTVGTTHMSYTDRFISTPEKEVETDKLCKILELKKHGFMFTGDLNALPGSYTINKILKLLKNAGPSLEQNTWTTKPFSYNGFDATVLDWRLDYCFCTSDIQVASAQIINTQFSDHLPLLIEFDFI